jgi:cell division protein FtsB
MMMSKYRKGFNLADAKRLAEATRSDYKDYIQPGDSDTAICILLDRVEKLEKENNKLKQDCKDWADDFQI